MPGTVVVVVPVHDEEALLGACLAALAVAVDRAEAAGIRCLVRVVLDACTDDSAGVVGRSALAAAPGFAVVPCAARSVGAARRAGIDDALASLAAPGSSAAGTDAAPGGPDGIWIACTDADSTVPPHWLLDHLAVADQADVYLGTVRPDFADLTPAHRDLWRRTHVRGLPAGNVHGANLGLRAELYRAVGGFAPLTEHEDVDLVARCRRAGAAVAVSDGAEVQTSGRPVGRTPGGYAAFVAATATAVAAGLVERQLHPR